MFNLIYFKHPVNHYFYEIYSKIQILWSQNFMNKKITCLQYNSQYLNEKINQFYQFKNKFKYQ